MQKEQITFGSFWKNAFWVALKDTGVLACFAAIGGAVLALVLLWWLYPNKRNDVPEGIGIAIAGGVCGLVLQFASRFLFLAPVKMANQSNAEKLRLEAAIQAYKQKERVRIDAKEFIPAHELNWYAGGFDINTMQHTSQKLTVGTEQACLKCHCHNLTDTPVILREIILKNADNGESVLRQDPNAKRIEANNTSEIIISLPLSCAPCNQTPAWRSQVIVKTARDEEFSSDPFSFAGLVKN
jgi:hypothetical protein